jgi:hypothetical protein
MIHLITYATENMSKAGELCCKSAKANGVHSAICADKTHIDKTFQYCNNNILTQERGAGYWLWKPYLIFRHLLSAERNDIVVYADAGVEFINNVSHIIEKMDEDIFFFGNNWDHVDWCKMDVIDRIIPNNKIDNLKQIQASVIFFKVNDNTRRFVKEWLVYCQMPDFIDDTPSKIPNYHTFQEHRHDQAILTCLQIKYGYKLRWWPASYSNGAFTYDKIEQYSNDNYPIIFNHHRKRNEEF